MKLIYGEMEHVLLFEDGYVNELVVENKKMFLNMVRDISMQSDGENGRFILSRSNEKLEISKYVEAIVQLVPFDINKKSLLNKLYAAIEKVGLRAENYMKTNELLAKTENYITYLASELSIDIKSQKLALSSIIKALGFEIDADDETDIEKVFSYMELVRELECDKLFVTVNMRTYFSDDEMERFVQSACLHGFKVLLLESTSYPLLKNTKRYTVDADLCEF